MIVGVLTIATSFSRCNPLWFLSMGLRQGSGLCSSSSRKYPGTEGTNQNRHWNHHRRHATNSLERTRLSCWLLYNHKGYAYRAPVRYVTKTWRVVLLNKETHILLSQVYYVWQVVKTLTVISNNPVCIYVCVCVCVCVYIYIYISDQRQRNIQGVPGGVCQTSEECSLC